MMKKQNNFFWLLLMATLLFPGLLHADLFEQLAVSPWGGSMGNAVTAYPPGALAIHYNPAGLADIPDTRFDNAIGYISTYRRVSYAQKYVDPSTGKLWGPFGGWFNHGKDPLDGAVAKQSSGYTIFPYIDFAFPYLFTPSMGISYKTPDPKYSRWTFGFGNFIPFGVGLRNSKSAPMSFLGQKAFMARMSFITPAIAYRLTDTVSIGASVGIGPSLFFMETQFRNPNDMSALTGALGEATEGLEIPVVSELTLPPPWFNGGMKPYDNQGSLDVFMEDYITTSYNLGLLWKPYEWFSFGACYQSESQATMEGDFKFVYGYEFRRTVDWFGRSPMTIITAAIFDLPTQSVPYQKGTATMDLTWPARLQMGVSFRPIKQVRFNCDANWTDWAAWKAWTIQFDQKIQLFRFARMLGYRYSPDSMVVVHNMKDTWHLSYGCEIKPDEKIALRLGYDPRPTSIRDNLFGPIPMSNITIYSAGIGLVVDDKPKPIPKNMHELTQQLNNPSAIDFTVSYIKLADKTVPGNTSKNYNSTSFTDIVYNPFAGLDVSQKMHIWWIALNQVYKW
jgi:long-subunit fatty acid transport protein